MRLKKAVIKVMSRSDLKAVVDEFEITSVDRRNRNSMAKSVGRRENIQAEDLMPYLAESQVKEVCELKGEDDTGRKNALIEMLLELDGGGGERKGARRTKSSSHAQATAVSAGPAPGPRTHASHKKGNGQPMTKLTLAQLERHLFGAADILRGKMDASEFKEFIFGMLFLKRASDQFEARWEEVLEAQLKKGRSHYSRRVSTKWRKKQDWNCENNRKLAMSPSSSHKAPKPRRQIWLDEKISWSP